MAPASAEVMLARDLPKQKTQEVLEATLMEVENLVLVLEKVRTGARVGKFYVDGKEIKWDLMVESKKVYEKDRVDDENNEDEEDVVIESEIDVNQVAGKECSVKENRDVKPIPEVVEEKKVEVVKEPVDVKKQTEDVTKPEPENLKKKPEVQCAVVEVPPVMKVSPSPKLTRMVAAFPPESGQDVAVFVVHVESVKKVWVCREEDEVRVSLLMDKLARLGEELKPAPRMKKGAVYGARFSQDGELYRVVLKEAVEGRVVVQFIDFGNKETKEEKELYDIPEEIGTEPAAAFEVSVKNNFEETDGNREVVEELLGENLTVAVTEVGAVFKINGEEVVFNQADANTSNITTASEEMVTMKDIKQSSPTQQQSVAVNHEVPAVASSSEVPVALVSSSEVPVAISAYSEAPTVSAIPEVSMLNPLPAAIPVATVPIPAPSVPQPVPTRTFAKAISALQSQLLARPRTSTGGSKEETVKTRQDREIVCPWSAGDKVVARWPDGVWRQAVVNKVEKGGKVNVVCEGLEEVMVDLINVRPHSLPVEALNLIDQGLNNSTVVRQKGDGASNEKKGVTPTVVGKVKEWMDKNMNQLTMGGGGSITELEVEDSMSSPLEATSKQSLERAPLPPSQDLPGYSRTSKGSLHIQSILNSANTQLSSHVLSSLLTGSPGPLSLMTSPKP